MHDFDSENVVRAETIQSVSMVRLARNIYHTQYGLQFLCHLYKKADIVATDPAYQIDIDNIYKCYFIIGPWKSVLPALYSYEYVGNLPRRRMLYLPRGEANLAYMVCCDTWCRIQIALISTFLQSAQLITQQSNEYTGYVNWYIILNHGKHICLALLSKVISIYSLV